MKWNILFGSLVMSIGLCNYCFGFELLDRMLGVGGGVPDPCCASPAGCGCHAAPACGCNVGCCKNAPSHCHAAPACGCKAAPSCACGPHPCRKYHCLTICLPKIEIPLPRIFFCHKCGCDCAPPCGGGDGGQVGPSPEAEGTTDEADLESVPAPAPIVDPAAFMPSHRSIVQASSVKVP